MIDPGLVGSTDFSLITSTGMGNARAEDAHGTPTQSHISPSTLVYEEKHGQVWYKPGRASELDLEWFPSRRECIEVSRSRGRLRSLSHYLSISLPLALSLSLSLSLSRSLSLSLYMSLSLSLSFSLSRRGRPQQCQPTPPTPTPKF